MSTTENPTTPRKRGLACVSPERRREIARQGGHAAFEKGVTRLFTAETGQAAGRLGGMPKHRAPRRSPAAPTPVQSDERKVEEVLAMD